MSLKRLELHNHTTESDASITCEELLHYMLENHVDAFALTDHNTISGHKKMAALLEALYKETNTRPIECIYGMEYTTYYGHILCLNLTEYVPWDSINLHKPELLFNAARRTGALAGIAHPYSFGYPFATGCRFEMTVTDYSAVDFIEIFNDPEPLHEVNEPALLLWEKLVLSGHRIAATCGMDLHGKWSFENQFATYINMEETDETPIAQALDRAVHDCRTWVSKGPVLVCHAIPSEETSASSQKGCIRFEIVDTGKEGCPVSPDETYILSLRSNEGELRQKMTYGVPLTIPCPALPVIPKLYREEAVLENLVCVSPVLFPVH